MNRVHFSSKRGDWPTPTDLFATLDAEFRFTLDAAASPENAKVANYYTVEDDALTQPWTGTVWLNPPYGRQIDKWIEKAICAADEGATVVLLVPAHTSSRWFQALLRWDAEVRFLARRVKFEGAREPAPFSSAIVVLRPALTWVSSDPDVTYSVPTRHPDGFTWTTMKVVRDHD